MYGTWFSYWWILIPAILLGVIAQGRVRSTYERYRKVRAASGVSGAQIARRILDANGLDAVPIERVAGQLTDHYDPRTRVLRLSEGVYSSTSIAALGVAAHEAGHALQHARSYLPLMARNTVYPVASFGSQLGPLLVLGGLVLGMIQPLIVIGILLFAFAALFSVVTLPVEFNASSRALQMLKNDRYLSVEELAGARQVLSAAALTYIASALASVLTLARLILLSRNNR
jgi:hypothetical protein